MGNQCQLTGQESHDHEEGNTAAKHQESNRPFHCSLRREQSNGNKRPVGPPVGTVRGIAFLIGFPFPVALIVAFVFSLNLTGNDRSSDPVSVPSSPMLALT